MSVASLSLVGLFMVGLLFIGFIAMAAKSPQARGLLIGGLALMAFLVFSLFAAGPTRRSAPIAQRAVPGVSLRPPAPVKQVYWNPPQQTQWTGLTPEQAGVETARVWQEYLDTQSAAASANAPIWSDKMEDEFEVDPYPSNLAAARALGRRMVEPIRGMMADPNGLVEVTLFQERTDQREFIAAFKRGLEQRSSNLRCSIEALQGSGPNELSMDKVGVEFHLTASWNGQLTATASAGDRRTSQTARFVGKPWVEDFADFAGRQPLAHYIVGRSGESCTSQGQARQQAIEDARQQLNLLISQGPTVSGRPPATVTPRSLQEGGFITDTFIQSLENPTNKVWRCAVLLNVTTANITGSNKPTAPPAQVDVRRVQPSARLLGQSGSAFGVLALILVTYFFLNMATKGYYRWSLGIAGAILAGMAIVAVLHLA